MRSTLQTLVVLALAVGLLALFLYHVDLRSVGSAIAHAQPWWLMLSFATTLINLAIRAYRWQYLLDPLGKVRFSSAFRATAVGFAASTVLPARAG
jgi:glycosyltransferase 2 family protein